MPCNPTHPSRHPFGYRKVIGLLAGALILSVLTGGVHAALNDLGDGQINDTTLNINWLQDANMVKTLCDANDPLWQSWPEPNLAVANNSGRPKALICMGGNGRLNWYEAEAWISHLNANSYLGHSDWRLPIVNQPDAACSDTDGNGQNYGFNCENGELANLFNVTLGNPNDQDDNCDPDCLHNTGPFTHFQSDVYWMGTRYEPNPALIWLFVTMYGNQFASEWSNSTVLYVWPVRPGNTAADPITQTRAVPVMGLWGIGLLGAILFGVVRRRLT